MVGRYEIVVIVKIWYFTGRERWAEERLYPFIVGLN